MTEPDTFRSVCVIGLGLIGGSVAAAARRAPTVGRVIGLDLPGPGARALALGLVDELAETAEAAVRGADLVVLAVPVPIVAQVMSVIAPALSPQALVTDCCSTKLTVIEAARTGLGPAWARFVPGHPIAGGEHSGPDAARPDLFRGKAWLLAPLDAAQRAAGARLQPLLEGFGATVSLVDAAEHDAMFAEYSHMPHALVFALCQAVADGPFADRLQALAGAGFKDTSRIGASSPPLWTDILLDNREQVLASTARVGDALRQFESVLRSGNREALLALITRASNWRAGLEPVADSGDSRGRG